ncbi:hypothetical protein [Paraburkholderia sp. J8-2]|uniref:hypothetical protein n=1 Tax=Paraburkholderia sp. J8-2 TaxID=2805440 RepID=UPI002AB6AF05|nr:hypothetical protein [Paraburkholderia sp. J8-2]
MKAKVLVVGLGMLAAVAHAAPVTLQQGGSLEQQLRLIMEHEGCTLDWRLTVDAPAQEAAQTYSSWTGAAYGTAKQISQVTAADKKIADLAAPVMCDDGKTLVMTTFRDSVRLVGIPGGSCHPLK